MSMTNVDTGAVRARVTREPGTLSLASEGGAADETTDIVCALRAKLEAHRRRCAKRAGWRRRFVPTGLKTLDRILPHGGLPTGSIIEILSEAHGVGSLSLSLRIATAMTGESFSCTAHEEWRDSFSALATAREQWHKVDPLGWRDAPASWRCPGVPELGHATRQNQHGGAGPMLIGSPATRDDHRAIVLIDTWEDFCFYPPAARRGEIDPHRLIVVRPRDVREALWAADQSLRCNAVAAVIAFLDRIDERDSRRLQLAAESSGCVGLILRPSFRTGKSFSAVRLLVEGVGSAERSVLQTGETGMRVDEHGGAALDHAAQPHGAKRNERGARLCRITLLKVREGAPAGPVIVDVNHETGDGVIPSVPVDRPAVKRA